MEKMERKIYPDKQKKELKIALFLFLLFSFGFLLLFFFHQKGFFFSLLSLAPISELRGSIPLAYFSYRWPLWLCYPLAVLLNSLICPLLLLFLDHLHPLLCRWKAYQQFVNRFLEKAQGKIKVKVEKYGMWGIMIFIAIPLPITGAYTGTAGAWILGLNRKKCFLAAFWGVAISGLIVCTLCFLIAHANLSENFQSLLKIFIKSPTSLDPSLSEGVSTLP